MIKQRIQEDVTESLKQGNSEVVGVLRMALASITSKEKEKRYKISKENDNVKEEELIQSSALVDDEVIGVLSSEIKKRKDAVVLYEKGDREELADKEKREIEILKKYLPEQLSKDELKKLIEETMHKVGAKETKDMGKVMAELMPKVKGKADNSEISKIIKDILSK